MKKDYPRYTLRVSKELLFKLSYIADFYGRTKNREIEYVLKKHITEFEKQYGVIPVPDDIADEE
ncbi:MAG: hypothetical protein J6C53_02760 [Clostridia bacterium]|nr:hypothetical protein [Clostridia bacterium]